VTRSLLSLVIKRNSNNYPYFKLENSSGTTIVEFTSDTKLLDADGPVLYCVSAKISTYQLTVLRGARLEGLVNVTAWKSGTWDINAATMTFGGSTITTPASKITGGAQAMWLGDCYFAPTTANLNKIVALDGKPADWGADGKTLHANCRAYLAGNAAAWNAGMNLASADPTHNFAITGTVT
jgi:hypothetical protein